MVFAIQDERIQWSLERLHVDPNITVESLHRLLNEVFLFPCPISINYVPKAIQSQVGFTLKLIRCELNGYNNEEHLREHIEWCQKCLKHSGNMVDVVYMDEVGFN